MSILQCKVSDHSTNQKGTLQEAKNWYVGRFTNKPLTFCGLKEIELKTYHKDAAKNSIVLHC